MAFSVTRPAKKQNRKALRRTTVLHAKPKHLITTWRVAQRAHITNFKEYRTIQALRRRFAKKGFQCTLHHTGHPTACHTPQCRVVDRWSWSWGWSVCRLESAQRASCRWKHHNPFININPETPSIPQRQNGPKPQSLRRLLESSQGSG